MTDEITRIDLLSEDLRDEDVDVKLTSQKAIRVKFIKLGYVAENLIAEALQAFTEQRRKEVTKEIEADEDESPILKSIKEMQGEIGLLSLEELRNTAANSDRMYLEEPKEGEEAPPLPDPDDYNDKNKEELLAKANHELFTNTVLSFEEFALRQNWPDYLTGMSEEEQSKASPTEIVTARESMIAAELKTRRGQLKKLEVTHLKRRIIQQQAQATSLIEANEFFAAIRLWDATRQCDKRDEKFFTGEKFPTTLKEALENPKKLRDALFESIHQDNATFEAMTEAYNTFLNPPSEEEIQNTAESPFRSEPISVERVIGPSPSLQ